LSLHPPSRTATVSWVFQPSIAGDPCPLVVGAVPPPVPPWTGRVVLIGPTGVLVERAAAPVDVGPQTQPEGTPGTGPEPRIFRQLVQVTRREWEALAAWGHTRALVTVAKALPGCPTQQLPLSAVSPVLAVDDAGPLVDTVRLVSLPPGSPSALGDAIVASTVSITDLATGSWAVEWESRDLPRGYPVAASLRMTVDGAEPWVVPLELPPLDPTPSQPLGVGPVCTMQPQGPIMSGALCTTVVGRTGAAAVFRTLLPPDWPTSLAPPAGTSPLLRTLQWAVRASDPSGATSPWATSSGILVVDDSVTPSGLGLVSVDLAVCSMLPKRQPQVQECFDGAKTAVWVPLFSTRWRPPSAVDGGAVLLLPAGDACVAWRLNTSQVAPGVELALPKLMHGMVVSVHGEGGGPSRSIRVTASGFTGVTCMRAHMPEDTSSSLLPPLQPGAVRMYSVCARALWYQPPSFLAQNIR
jgi:hypothetical protein